MPIARLSGADIHYEIAGSGQPAFVLIHGGGCTSRDWRPQFALAEHGAVLALDLRCHGRSSGVVADCTIERWAEDVNALIDAVGMGSPVLVGHSLGARIAAQAAWQRPDHAAGLVLLDGSRSVRGFAAVEAPVGESSTVPGDGSLEAILDATIGPYADAAVRAHVLQEMTAAPMAVLQQAVVAYTAWDTDRADAVVSGLPAHMPVLAIQSTYHDRFTPRRSLAPGETTSPYLEFLKRAVPQLEIAILPETGHFSMLERSAQVNALLGNFAAAGTIQRLPGATASI